MSAHTAVIGVGNDQRGDDAAGLLAARALRERLPSEVDVLEQPGEGAALMDAWEGYARVVIVDAVQAGGEPGRLYRLDARAGAIPAKFFNYSTHAFSVAEAVETARVLDQLPAALVLYGIEGARYAMGDPVSPEVDLAVGRVVDRILAELVLQEAQRDARAGHGHAPG